MTARIFRPARTAMQSGKGKTKRWMLVHDQSAPRQIDPLMGYTSATDMSQQIKMSFETLEEAEAYARNAGLAYTVQEPQVPNAKKVSYPNNFRHDRKIPWTH